MILVTQVNQTIYIPAEFMDYSVASKVEIDKAME